MKTPVYACLVLFAGLAITAAQRAKPHDDKPPPHIQPGATILISGTNAWTLEQLNQKAIASLRAKGNLPDGPNVTAIVHINLDDTNLLCEIHYSQGFGSHEFTARVSRNGELASITDNGVSHEAAGETQRQFFEKYSRNSGRPSTNSPPQK